MSEFINTADIIGDEEMCDQIIMRTVTEYKENRIAEVGQYAFYECKSLETVDLPNVLSVGLGAFYGCSSLIDVSLPSAITLSQNAFQNSGIEMIHAPNVMGALACFFNCSSLKEVCFPLVTTLGDSAFRWTGSLTYADFTNLKSITGNWNFQEAPLKAFVLRNASSVCSLSNTTHFTGSAIAKGTGYIYVPCAFLSDTDATKDYRRATNWSTYAAQFRAIEDYTNDGTVTGSFHWCTGVELDKTSLTFDEWKTQTLTATMLTPSPHDFDVVEWKSADESIAVVANGVVRPVSKGTTTITASCNGYSASCEVTVNAEGFPMLYSLGEPKTFNGTSDYIDTGIKLFDTAKDFTIVCEAEFSKLIDQNKCLFHCMNEASPWPGLSIDGSNGIRICYTGSSSITTSISNRNDVSTLAIRYVDGKMNAIRYRNASGNIVTHAVSGTPTYTKVTQNLLLGAYQEVSGTKGRFYNGTISRFDVYSTALSDEQIEVFL